jgi:hypothetical protein
VSCLQSVIYKQADVSSKYLNAEVLGLDLVNIQPEKYAARPCRLSA